MSTHSLFSQLFITGVAFFVLSLCCAQTEATACPAGMWGSDCSLACPANCNGTCDQTSGACSACINSTSWSPYCNETCSAACSLSQCDFTTGTCTLGCQQSTVWGPSCTTNCSSACESSFCDSFSGTCLGCANHTFWGPNCNVSCSAKCTSGGDCDATSGNCMYCEDGTTWGPDCSTNCSSACLADSCWADSGNCLGCSGSFWGPACNLTCPGGCYGYCDGNTGMCNTCKPGLWGPFCSEPCPGGCNATGSCNMTSGVCTTCDAYHSHPPVCSSDPCKANCNGSGSVCVEAICFACNWGLYNAPSCTGTCPKGCKDLSTVGCHNNGTCFGCLDGFSGPTCTQNSSGGHTILWIVVVLLIAAALAVGFFGYRRYQARQRSDALLGAGVTLTEYSQLSDSSDSLSLPLKHDAQPGGQSRRGLFDAPK